MLNPSMILCVRLKSCDCWINTARTEDNPNIITKQHEWTSWEQGGGAGNACSPTISQMLQKYTNKSYYSLILFLCLSSSISFVFHCPVQMSALYEENNKRCIYSFQCLWGGCGSSVKEGKRKVLKEKFWTVSENCRVGCMEMKTTQ